MDIEKGTIIIGWCHSTFSNLIICILISFMYITSSSDSVVYIFLNLIIYILISFMYIIIFLSYLFTSSINNLDFTVHILLYG